MTFYAERIFPWLMEKSIEKPSIRARRAKLLAPVRGDVLEIGFGSGLNLPYYDRARVSSLSVVEPSTGMNKRARGRIAVSGWTVRLDELAGERLPYPDESFDYVVSCLTLCSVDDPAQVLREVKRVLRPSGRLCFLEHVASRQISQRRWQDRLNPIHKVIGVGCNLNRDTVALVREAGFEIDDPEHQDEPAFALHTIMPIVEAEARKPG